MRYMKYLMYKKVHISTCIAHIAFSHAFSWLACFYVALCARACCEPQATHEDRRDIDGGVATAVKYSNVIQFKFNIHICR